MAVEIESLPWDSLRLPTRDIPWGELRILAEACAESGDVRTRLTELANRAIEEAESGNSLDEPNFADFAVPAVFGLAAAKFDQAGRRDAARSLLNLLYRAGETDSDYLLETAEASAGMLGHDIVEPVLEFLHDQSPHQLECWFHVVELLRLAAQSEEPVKRRVIEFCQKHLRESPDRYERFSAVYPLAHVLAALNDTESLPLLRELFEASDDADLMEAIQMLEGQEVERYTSMWERPIEEWFTEKVNLLHNWLEEEPEDEDLDFQWDGKADDLPDVPDFSGTHDEVSRRSHDSSPFEATNPIRRAYDKVGRNDPCPCDSGKKYKKCCGR